MRAEEKTEFRDLVTHIGKEYGNNNARLRKQALTGFLAMVGTEYRKKQYKKKLMVIGRAVNGWTDSWTPAEVTENSKINQVVKETYRSVTEVASCPMHWVSEAWGKTHTYNTKKSAFWRVIRRIVGGLDIADIEGREWPSSLIWSNLYKISPADGGNPSEKLCQIQEPYCKRLLEIELDQWKPGRVLLLTGKDWVKPFKDILRGYNPVVKLHPQGKPETKWVKKAVEQLK